MKTEQLSIFKSEVEKKITELVSVEVKRFESETGINVNGVNVVLSETTGLTSASRSFEVTDAEIGLEL